MKKTYMYIWLHIFCVLIWEVCDVKHNFFFLWKTHRSNTTSMTTKQHPNGKDNIIMIRYDCVYVHVSSSWTFFHNTIYSMYILQGWVEALNGIEGYMSFWEMFQLVLSEIDLILSRTVGVVSVYMHEWHVWLLYDDYYVLFKTSKLR